MPKMPKQKPGKSKQEYGTPDDLLVAVKRRLHIPDFYIDLAASHDNSVAAWCFTEEDDALSLDWPNKSDLDEEAQVWNWCNPPYANITSWVKKAKEEASKGAQTVMLVPASVGSNWFASYVEPYAFVSYLNPRLTFKGELTPYPKDCMLLFYTPWGFTGHEVWYWKNRIGG